MLREVVIHEHDAERIDEFLDRFLDQTGAKDGLLIDRSGQLLAGGRRVSGLDTVSISALAAGAFSSTAAVAQLLGEPEFSILFHEGTRESMLVSAVDEETILLAVFDDRATVGMVRLFALEAGRAIRGVLANAQRHARTSGPFIEPLGADNLPADVPMIPRASDGGGR